MAVVVSPIIMESLTLPSKMNQLCFLNHVNRVNIVILVIMCVCGLLPTGRIIRDSKSVDLREIYKKKGETVDDKKLEFLGIVSSLFIVILSALYDGVKDLKPSYRSETGNLYPGSVIDTLARSGDRPEPKRSL